jgi:hypothetical protein
LEGLSWESVLPPGKCRSRCVRCLEVSGMVGFGEERWRWLVRKKTRHL